jgi:SAM-dependent methyltransferase
MPQDTPLYFRFLAWLLRPFPDFDFGFIKPVRARAVAALRLHEGDRVLDLGCGPGGSLPFLRAAVGASGEVLGVEISARVATLAARRIARRGWSNVRVLVAPAEQAELPASCDGVLMFAAPDVYASPAAWANLRRALRPGARVAFFGVKTSSRRGGWLLNGLFRAAMPRLSFASTPVPTDAPWTAVGPELRDVEVQEHFLGWMFLATGTWLPGDAEGAGAAAGAAFAEPVATHGRLRGPPPDCSDGPAR